MRGKKTESIRVYMSEELLREIERLARHEGLPVSAYAGRLIHKHVYGYRMPDSENPEVLKRDY